jgi:polyphosphate kinase
MGDSSAIRKKDYLDELERLTVELVKLQEWVKAKGLKVVALFEGRDAAGKGGVIKAITGGLNPRSARIAALPAPTEKEKTQWYFQRYVAQLPAGGELVFFDRSWYNRAGVERVMGFCTEAEYREFARSVPEFERMLIRSGIHLLKYWFSVSDEVQEARFKDRLEDPAKRWKLSPMDMTARSKWVDYSRAKDEMFEFSDIPDSPWHVVDADDKYCARLNVITHLLRSLPYEDLTPEAIELPPRQKAGKYARPPMDSQKWLPRIYPGALAREPSESADEDAGASEAAAPTTSAPVKAGSGKKGEKKDKKKK